MRSTIVLILATLALGLSACGERDRNTEGNGPGTADGAGARTDPPVQEQPANEQLPAQEQQPQPQEQQPQQ
ncbi:MAG TPA: hypothetical protein VFO35_04175 [Steroidobacteraceae bacterium]|nr:hypothetical protein [Steroidobacteraceae bacterium]